MGDFKLSLNDSFIKEVSEEVRRDKLFKYFKKYSWIGILLIFILVCAVAINEWMKQNEKLSNLNKFKGFFKICECRLTLYIIFSGCSAAW